MSALFFCTDCGFETTKWSGKCPSCGSWNTLKESSRLVSKKNTNQVSNLSTSSPAKLVDIKKVDRDKTKTGIHEFDLVLGGGVVPGMVVLIGGEPGIGKSTLMLQLSEWLGKVDRKVLYCSGEESADQIQLRSERLQVHSPNIWLLCTNETESIINATLESKPDLVIVDSIQSVSLSSIDSVPGSVTQLRESCNRLLRVAKENNIPMLIIGHVTKDGIVAGPKIIEHMVDTVLYFEGELRNQYKILRAVKNRFGSTNEIGLFEMTNAGLIEVTNPNNVFLIHENQQIGTCIGCILEGTRSFTVEVQALATASNYGTPQRVVVGLDHKRLAMLLAVLEKNLSLYLRSSDVFVNLTGGIKTIDPSLDLAIIAAIISSLKDTPLPEKSIFIGEVGLNGEIRPVPQLESRVKEAIKLGYEKIYISELAKIKIKPNIIRLKELKSLYAIFGQ